ncbi:hypothetical protein [Fusobacterium varium]|uniref:hypothetical protein n=1 Tax=Fusobacterium varium TaxID=856 RepID=UPI0022E6B9F7|nr:hypothetical protein [Fusobacterium varium]
MWRCKECGGEIIGIIESSDSFEFSLDEYGNPNEFLSSTKDIEQIIKQKRNIVGMYCEDCDIEIEDLEEEAVWED